MTEKIELESEVILYGNNPRKSVIQCQPRSPMNTISLCGHLGTPALGLRQGSAMLALSKWFIILFIPLQLQSKVLFKGCTELMTNAITWWKCHENLIYFGKHSKLGLALRVRLVSGFTDCSAQDAKKLNLGKKINANRKALCCLFQKQSILNFPQVSISLKFHFFSLKWAQFLLEENYCQELIRWIKMAKSRD